MTRKFHLGDILSITTGRMLSPRHMEGIYDILNYMTGDNLFTHQLPRAMKECQPYLLEQHHQLKEVSCEKVKDYAEWLHEQVGIYGETLAVSPIPTAAHEVKNPIAELVELTGSSKQIMVVERG